MDLWRESGVMGGGVGMSMLGFTGRFVRLGRRSTTKQIDYFNLFVCD